LIRSLGARANADVRVYLTGGSTAVLEGWRASTKDIDLKLVPDDEGILRSIPEMKERLEINVELASPDDFIPPLPGWEERSRFISKEGKASFFHYDFYAQALAKLERGHVLDLADVAEMVRRDLIDPGRLEPFLDQIEPSLYRYPAVDPRSFRRRVEELVDRSRSR
jgi:hypothetical protein